MSQKSALPENIPNFQHGSSVPDFHALKSDDYHVKFLRDLIERIAPYSRQPGECKICFDAIADSIILHDDGHLCTEICTKCFSACYRRRMSCPFCRERMVIELMLSESREATRKVLKKMKIIRKRRLVKVHSKRISG